MSTTTVNISANQVKELREKTGAPMMDCKHALTEAKGDLEQAVVLLRKRGISVAGKKASRVTKEGAVASYIHAGGKIGVLVEVNCESDFVARTDDFKELVHDIAMHIAASDPKFVRKEDVSPEAFEREKDIYRSQAAATGKPPQVVEKIVEGKMSKFYEEVCLLEQPFIRDQTVSIGQLIATKIGKLGENIAVRRFARFKVGEVGATVAFTTSNPDDGAEAPLRQRNRFAPAFVLIRRVRCNARSRDRMPWDSRRDAGATKTNADSGVQAHSAETLRRSSGRQPGFRR